MLHTNSKDGQTVSVETDYDVPKAGDTLNIFGHEIVLAEDMKLGFDWNWNKDKREYIASPCMTIGKNPIPVFFADGFSWRVTD